MQLDEILKKRVRGMSVRILACIEHTLSCHLDGIDDDEKFKLHGSDLKLLRSEILNAAGDTTRSLTSLVKDQPITKISFDRATITALNRAEVGFEPFGDEETTPFFIVKGDFNLLHKIREQVGTGVVYNNRYVCIGLDPVVDSLMPFLDQAKIAGIKIADGDYTTWRQEVCQEYMGGLNDE